MRPLTQNLKGHSKIFTFNHWCLPPNLVNYYYCISFSPEYFPLLVHPTSQDFYRPYFSAYIRKCFSPVSSFAHVNFVHRILLASLSFRSAQLCSRSQSQLAQTRCNISAPRFHSHPPQMLVIRTQNSQKIGGARLRLSIMDVLGAEVVHAQ